MGEEVRVHRRGFLAAMGLTAGAALVLRSAVSAQASTVKAPVRGKNDSRFRRGRVNEPWSKRQGVSETPTLWVTCDSRTSSDFGLV